MLVAYPRDEESNYQ